MTEIRMSGSAREIAAALERIAAIGRNPARVLHAVGEQMIKSTQRRFHDGKGPDGKAWAPLNPAYAASSGPRQGGILVRTAHLRDGISSYVDGRTLVWGSNLVYSAVHQFGAVIKPKTKKALFFSIGGHEVIAGSVTIPARPYLGFTAADRLTVIEELEEALARAVAGR